MRNNLPIKPSTQKRFTVKSFSFDDFYTNSSTLEMIHFNGNISNSQVMNLKWIDLFKKASNCSTKVPCKGYEG